MRTESPHAKYRARNFDGALPGDWPRTMRTGVNFWMRFKSLHAAPTQVGDFSADDRCRQCDNVRNQRMCEVRNNLLVDLARVRVLYVLIGMLYINR
ncbi:hypothetical protein EVAR_62188_1 [Eumeta japonica]|uniref:Uncharacterized protein n=1 Tax=Eumeta variegata TaxID=151549 RepID=A0A4C1Z699_EUMVA|nr:hypothetical protein EVAR_62188_1 [Eumeta japonica]